MFKPSHSPSLSFRNQNPENSVLFRSLRTHSVAFQVLQPGSGKSRWGRQDKPPPPHNAWLTSDGQGLCVLVSRAAVNRCCFGIAVKRSQYCWQAAEQGVFRTSQKEAIRTKELRVQCGVLSKQITEGMSAVPPLKPGLLMAPTSRSKRFLIELNTAVPTHWALNSNGYLIAESSWLLCSLFCQRIYVPFKMCIFRS